MKIPPGSPSGRSVVAAYPAVPQALAVLIGKVAAADLKMERLRTLLVEKRLIEENELKMNHQEVEDFIVQEFANVLQGLGLASEMDQ